MKYEFDNIENRIRENAEMIKVPNELEPQNVAVMLKEKRVSDALSSKKHKGRAAMRFAAGATAFAVVATGGIFAAKNAGVFDNGNLKDDASSPNRPEYSLLTPSEEILAPKASYDEVYDTLQIAYDNAYGAAEEPKSEGFFDWLFDITTTTDDAYNDYNNGAESNIAADMETAPEMDYENIEEDEVGDFMDSDSSVSDDDGTSNDTVGENKDYSETITQVEGVAEADIVKTNGDDIFYIANNTLYEIPIENGIFGEITEIASHSGTNNEFIDMFLYDDKLITVSSIYDDSEDYAEYSYSEDIYISDCVEYLPNDTVVNVYGLSDDSETSYTQSGGYVSSRMIEDTLYLVTNDESKNLAEIDPQKKASFVPSYYCNGEEEYIPAEDIVVTEDITNLNYGIVSSLNVNSANEPTSVKAIAGFTGEVYCSQDNIYIAGARYDYENYKTNTYITRIAIEDSILSTQATAVINGTVLNQYSMDEYNGYFRVASTYNTGGTEITDEGNGESGVVTYIPGTDANAVYIYDMDMQLVGKCENLGIDETIRSVRFSGDIGYVVTFMQTDPLYAIDLSDPANPSVLDEFKISGYSTFLHPYGENLMFSFGVEADEETGWTTGLKVTMYDTSDPNNLQALDSYVWENVDEYLTTGDGVHWNYHDSGAVYDEKALYIDAENNLIGIPIYEIDYYERYLTQDYSYQETQKSCYYMLKFENGEFVIESQYEKEIDLDNYFYFEFNRGLRIDNYFYMLSEYHLASMNLDDMSVVDEVENYGNIG